MKSIERPYVLFVAEEIYIEVDYSSISAKEKIENLGGILKIKNPK